jgi:hypothetical protein
VSVPSLEPRRIAALTVRAGVGLVLLIAGWWGARDEVALDRQAPWVAVTVVGVVVAAASVALWLLSTRRAVAARVAAVVARVGALPEAPVDRSVAELRVRRRSGASVLFHRPDCALVAGRTVRRGQRERWIDDGLVACEACQA